MLTETSTNKSDKKCECCWLQFNHAIIHKNDFIMITSRFNKENKNGAKPILLYDIQAKIQYSNGNHDYITIDRDVPDTSLHEHISYAYKVITSTKCEVTNE